MTVSAGNGMPFLGCLLKWDGGGFRVCGGILVKFGEEQ